MNLLPGNRLPPLCFQFCPNCNAGHNYVHVHVVQVLQTHSGTIGFAPEMYNEPQLLY